MARIPPPPSSNPVAYIGQSNALRQVVGYGEVGGKLLWSHISGFSGGTISRWAAAAYPDYWAAFEYGYELHGQPSKMWISMGQHHGDKLGGGDYTPAELKAFMVTILAKIRSYPWMVGVPLFWSAVNGYSYANAVAWQDCQAALLLLMADRGALAETAESMAMGPLLRALDKNQTTDSIHPNGPTGTPGGAPAGVTPGRQVGGADLKGFFG